MSKRNAARFPDERAYARETSEQPEFVNETEGETEMTSQTETTTVKLTIAEEIAAVKARLAALRAEQAAGKTPRERKQGTGGPRGYAAVLAAHQEDVQGLCQDLLDGSRETEDVVDELLEIGFLSEKEAKTLICLAGEGHLSQKDTADYLGCNTWQVYNYRRDALRKVAGVLGTDWEDLCGPLGMRRGTPKPERHTQYWPKGEGK